MEKYFDGEFGDGSGRAIDHGQATDGYFADGRGRANVYGQTTGDCFSDGSKGEQAYGQTADGFGNTKQSFDFHEPIMLAQNNEYSNAMVQLEASVPQPQATLVTGTSMPNQDTSQSKVAKRARDKAYRERLKKRKIEMEGNMATLTQRNKVLEDENGNLQSENTHLNEVVQSQANEINQFKNDVERLKHECKRQNGLVQILSEILAGYDLSPGEKIQKLQNENDLLRQGMGVDCPNLQLIEENAKLKHEVRALKVQIGAVCGKIIAENSSPSPSS